MFFVRVFVISFILGFALKAGPSMLRKQQQLKERKADMDYQALITDISELVYVHDWGKEKAAEVMATVFRCTRDYLATGDKEFLRVAKGELEEIDKSFQTA